MAQKIYLHFLSCIVEKPPKRWTKSKRAYTRKKTSQEEQKSQYEKNQFLIKLVLSNQQTEKCQPLTL